MEKSKPKFNHNYPIVYYYRRSNSDDDQQILYSIRSACKNLNPSKVIVVGDKPEWFYENPKAIWFPSFPERSMSWTIGWVPFQHFTNFIQKNWDFEDFLLFNDDFFIMKPVYDWIDYERAEKDYMAKTFLCKPYHAKTLATFKLVEGRKYFNLHLPMRMKVSNVKVLVSWWKSSLSKDLDFRTFYGNLFISDYPNLQAIDDVKVRDDTYDPSQTFLSTSIHNYHKGGFLRTKIEELFQEPCFCERPRIDKVPENHIIKT